MNRFVFSVGLFCFVLISISNVAYCKELEPSEITSLQETINQSKGGEILILRKGTYQGPITISKPMTIRGEKGTVIDGGFSGSVITVTADNVKISGLTIVNSGNKMEDSGFYLDKVSSIFIENNVIKNVHNGIYIKNGRSNKIQGNVISSTGKHFSKKGNGIHIFKGEDNIISENQIHHVQDGIYFDFAKRVVVSGNEIRDSRYGMHFMFSGDITANENKAEENITGFMIMDSSHLRFTQNHIRRQFHFRGFGVLIYNSQDILLHENEIIQNSTAVSFEKAVDTELTRNIIAANQIGLEFRSDNKDNHFSRNNFISNIVSSKIGHEEVHLDDGDVGNYWDDYDSYDITGDGIGEIPYKAGTLYDNLLKKQPLWQFFFESPAIQIWGKAESMFPSLGKVEVYDNKPLVKAVNLDMDEKKEKRSHLLGIVGVLFVGVSLFTIWRGTSYR